MLSPVFHRSHQQLLHYTLLIGRFYFLHFGVTTLQSVCRLIGFYILSALWAPVAQSHESLPIGVSFFPPFKYMEDGIHVGSDTEIVVGVIANMGYEPAISVHPWKRIQAEGRAGKYALIYTFTKNPEREKYFYFSNPISAIRDVFFKRKDRNIQWDTLEDLAPLIVSASDGYNYHESFNRAAKSQLFNMNWVLGDHPELTHLKLLQAERVDLAICEVSVCQFLIRRNPKFNQIDFINKSIGPVRTFHVGFSKAWPGAEQLAETFNRTLKAFVATGKRDEILKKYGIESYPD